MHIHAIPKFKFYAESETEKDIILFILAFAGCAIAVE